MSEVQTNKATITLPLDLIKVGENPVRHFPDTVDETKAFADKIRTEGLINPLGVKEIEDGKYSHELVHGWRRYRALEFIAEEDKIRSLPVVCTVEEGGDTFGVTVGENLGQKTLSHVELALLCRDVRERYGWQGEAGTKQVAEFLGVSKTQVTQHEKLLLLPKSEQVKIHRGELSANAAFEIADPRSPLTNEQRTDILNRAAEIEKEELGQKKADAKARLEKVREKKAKVREKLQAAKKEGDEKIVEAVQAEVEHLTAKEQAAKKAAEYVEKQEPQKVSARSVRKAAAESGVVRASKSSRTMKEWLAVVEILRAEHMPRRARSFADTFVMWQGMKMNQKRFAEILTTECFK